MMSSCWEHPHVILQMGVVLSEGSEAKHKKILLTQRVFSCGCISDPQLLPFQAVKFYGSGSHKTLFYTLFVWDDNQFIISKTKSSCANEQHVT